MVASRGREARARVNTHGRWRGPARGGDMCERRDCDANTVGGCRSVYGSRYDYAGVAAATDDYWECHDCGGHDACGDYDDYGYYDDYDDTDDCGGGCDCAVYADCGGCGGGGRLRRLHQLR